MTQEETFKNTGHGIGLGSNLSGTQVISSGDTSVFAQSANPYSINIQDNTDIFNKPMSGMRSNEGKPDPTFLHNRAFLPAIQVLEFGAKKYARDNWKGGGDKFTKLAILASMKRHVDELIDKVNTEENISENDLESGIHEIGHIMCNAMFYAYHHIPGCK